VIITHSNNLFGLGVCHLINQGPKGIEALLSQEELQELQNVANSNFDGRLASSWLDGEFALSLIPLDSDASEFAEGGAVLFVGYFAELEEKPTFAMDGIALFTAQGD
jgi:hypothetical protein